MNSSDPEYRGRVQVFVPHIMPALYDGWNKEGADIQISCVGSNIPEGLTPEIHQRLIQILPWAESASPIIGGSAPGNLFSDMLGGAARGAATGGIAGAVVGAVAAGVNHVYNQGPTSAPVQVEGGDAQGLINKAKGITGLDYDPDPRSAKNSLGGQWGMCARGTTGLDKAAGLIDKIGASAGFDAASDLAVGGVLFNKPQVTVQTSKGPVTYINPYVRGTGAQYFEPAFTVDAKNYVPQVGDSVFCGGGSTSDRTGKYLGHAQKCVGFDKAGKAIWVSDNPQSNGFSTSNKTASYKDFTVYRLNKEGLAKYTAAIGGKVTGQEPPSSTALEQTGGSGVGAPPNPQAKPEGPQEGDVAPTPQTMTAGGPGTGTPAGTISGGGTDTQGLAKLAADRQARFASELSDPAIQKQLGYLASREVDNAGNSNNVRAGSNEINQQQFIETVVNRAMFSNRSVSSVISDMGYWIPPEKRRTEPDYRQRADYQSFAPTASYNTALNKVLQGGNLTNLATDNASNVGTNTVADKRIADGVTGSWLKNGQVVGRNEGEFYYRGDGKTKYFSTAGRNATKYANENGINQSSAVASSESIVAAASQAPSVINNTDSNGRTPVHNMNDMASGLFAFPNPGAMVWVFFREGNPLYPVYFAASYSSAEWQSAYRGSSPGNQIDFSNPGKVATEASHFKPSSALAISTRKRTNLDDPLDNESVASISHEHGSGIHFKNGCDFFRSAANKRDEVDNDRHEVTRGYKDTWIEGDESKNTRGDSFIKVGNITQEAIDAMNELSEMSYKMNQMLKEKPNNQNSGGGTKEAPNPTDQAEIDKYTEAEKNARLLSIRGDQTWEQKDAWQKQADEFAKKRKELLARQKS